MKTQKWNKKVDKAEHLFSEVRPFKTKKMASGDEEEALVTSTQSSFGKRSLTMMISWLTQTPWDQDQTT